MNPHRSKANRAFVLTPPGVAAIAVVRCVGPDAIDFIQSHFSRKLQPGKAVHGSFRDPFGNEIDDPLIFLSTDESFIDINLHGGAWVVRSVLQSASQAGFETVHNPPSPLPDELIDSTDVIQREIDAFLPLATTEIALRTLLAQEPAWRSIRAEQIDSILADRSLYWLLHPPRVAIVGAPNAGKSTLANQLFAQERSITADLPGTTRDWVGEIANIDGLAIQLIDTPGIRQTPDDIERLAIASSGKQIEKADLIILVIDASQPPDPNEYELLKRYELALILLNKIDLIHPGRTRLGGIETVATTGQGINQLRSAIRQQFDCNEIDPTQPRCWTDRQRDDLQKRKNRAT